MLRVAAFTGGLTVPSARFRVRQFTPTLLELGVAVSEMPSSLGIYPPQKKWQRPAWASATLLAQVPNIIKSYQYDVVLLQREMLSSFATLERCTKKPRVLDVDDAIFLLRDGKCARNLAQISERVICGNMYLANWFNQWNKNITIIPTAVDTDQYVPAPYSSTNEVVIGWIGTSGNLKYVYAIEDALAKVMALHPHIKLRIVSDKAPTFKSFDMSQYEFIAWSEKIEVQSIQSFDIGIMPLEDTLWARGKCSFKMLQYMACGIPVVVSPVGMNTEVLAMGNLGYGAETVDQWVDALVALIESSVTRHAMGAMGRRVAIDSFSVSKLSPILAASLHI